MPQSLKYLHRFFVYKSDPSFMSMHAACPVPLGCIGYFGAWVFGHIELELLCHKTAAQQKRHVLDPHD